MLRMQQNHSFCCVPPPMSVVLLFWGLEQKTTKKPIRERVDYSFWSRSCFKLVLGFAGLGFGGFRTSLGWLFGAAWPVFERSWAPLGLSWAPLGYTLGASGTTLGFCCLVWDGFSLTDTCRALISELHKSTLVPNCTPCLMWVCCAGSIFSAFFIHMC